MGSVGLSAQSFYTLQPRVGFYQMAEKGWEPLTLHLTAVDLILNQGARTTVYLGPRMAGNFLGVRAGYISLGGHLGIQRQLSSRLSLRAEVLGSAGGGGYAQDGDGWVLGSTASMLYEVRNQRLEAGITYNYASGGMIGGFSPVIGWTKSVEFLNAKSSVERAHSGSPVPVDFCFSGQWNLGKRPFGNQEGSKVFPFFLVGSTIGFESNRVQHRFSLNAAVDTFGGYMNVINSLGFSMLNSKWISLSPEVYLGAGGGGRALFLKGGLHYGVGVVSDFNVSDLYAFRVSLQKMYTNGPWSYTGVQLGLRKKVSVLSRNSLNSRPTVVSNSTQRIILSPGIKVHLSDLGSVLSIGGELNLYKKQNFDVFASTWWAAVGGNRGAYAEGLMGMRWWLSKNLAMKSSIGVGAGGGINHLDDATIGSLGVILGHSTTLSLEFWRKAPTLFSATLNVPLEFSLAGFRE
jgi:hypothetical protein